MKKTELKRKVVFTVLIALTFRLVVSNNAHSLIMDESAEEGRYTRT